MSDRVAERSPVPLQPRALSHESAEHLDLLAGRLQQGSFLLGGSPWRFRLQAAAAPAPWPSTPFVIGVEWGGAPFWLVCSPALLSLLYAHQFPEVDLAQLPEELALAAFELAWSELAAKLEPLSGRRVRLVSAARDAALPDLSGCFAFRLGLDSEAARDGVDALLLTDAPGLALLALLARRQPVPPRSVPDPETPLPLRVELGETCLTVAQLRALALHDVVLLDCAGFDPADAPINLRVDARRRLRARLRGDALTLESALETLPMPATPAGAAETPADLDQIEIRLSFDLGEKTVTLGELAALQPGQVFALDAPLPRAVAIRANGRLVGRGELVRVEDSVGVRVLELAAREGGA